MEKNRRKSNPTKIERKSANMAADAKDVAFGRKESTNTFFQNEIEWEKRRLQRMKHLKCCPRVPNRVLVALAMGDASSASPRLVSSYTCTDPKLNSAATSCGQVLGVTAGEAEYLRENNVTHGSTCVLPSADVGLYTNESFGNVCRTSQCGPESHSARVAHAESFQEKEVSSNEHDSFDTEAFLCSAFGHSRSSQMRESSSSTSDKDNVNSECCSNTTLGELHSPDGSLGGYCQPEAGLQDANNDVCNKQGHVLDEGKSNLMDIKVEIGQGHSSRPTDSVLSSEEKEFGEDHGRERIPSHEKKYRKPVKVEVCDPESPDGTVFQDEGGGTDGCVPAAKRSDTEEDTPLRGQKRSPRLEHLPVINLAHSVGVRYSKNGSSSATTVHSTDSSPMRTGFIDLNSTKAVTQEHVLKNMRGMQQSRSGSVYPTTSFIVLDHRSKLERQDDASDSDRSNQSVPSLDSSQSRTEIVLGQKRRLCSTHRSESQNDEDNLEQGSEKHDSCNDMEVPSLITERTSPRLSSEAVGREDNLQRTERAFLGAKAASSNSHSFLESPVHADSGRDSVPSVVSHSQTINRSIHAKRSEIALNNSDMHVDGTLQHDDSSLPRVSSYRGYDPSFDCHVPRSANRTVNLSLRNLGAPKRVHPDFQSLEKADFREVPFSHAIVESLNIPKMPRRDTVPFMETRESLPLAGTQGQKAKLTSFVTPHQNQALMFRHAARGREGQRPRRGGHSCLTPRIIGEENVNNLFDPLEISPNKLSQWTSLDVSRYLEETDCREFASVFLQQEIDGKTLLVLTEEQISRLLKIKIGPAIKIYSHITNLKNALSSA